MAVLSGFCLIFEFLDADTELHSSNLVTIMARELGTRLYRKVFCAEFAAHSGFVVGSGRTRRTELEISTSQNRQIGPPDVAYRYFTMIYGVLVEVGSV